MLSLTGEIFYGYSLSRKRPPITKKCRVHRLALPYLGDPSA